MLWSGPAPKPLAPINPLCCAKWAAWLAAGVDVCREAADSAFLAQHCLGDSKVECCSGICGSSGVGNLRAVPVAGDAAPAAGQISQRLLRTVARVVVPWVLVAGLWMAASIRRAAGRLPRCPLLPRSRLNLHPGMRA